MSTPSELSLDICKPHSYSMLLKSFGEHNDQTLKLEEFLSRLEEERQKIDVFKRELPLCMQLLTNAVETSRQQLQAYRANQGGRPAVVLEEFIPLNNNKSSSDTLDKTSNISDKVNWMTTAQLWSHDVVNETKPQPQPQTTISTTCAALETNNNIGFNVSPKLCLDTKKRNGGAFLPFSKERNSCSTTAATTLALSSPEQDNKKNLLCSESDQNGNEQGKGSGNSSLDDHHHHHAQTNNNNTNNQTHRKARRCWSPDLHRRFVNALQMLGGSQVATPKQIRELMKVDGLTNDEVKSHLQKYRLHTRRPSPSPQAAAAPAAQLVVLGGIWVPPEYATAAHGYGGHHHHPAAPPPHFLPHQDHFYTTTTTTHAPPPHQSPMHHHTLHQQLHMYKPTSQPHSSPEESDLRGTGGGGDRFESIEDGKSESSSWKADQNGDERKGLAALREDGEESNGSQITLKF